MKKLNWLAAGLHFSFLRPFAPMRGSIAGSWFTLPNFVRKINFLIEYEYETSLEFDKLIKVK